VTAFISASLQQTLDCTPYTIDVIAGQNIHAGTAHITNSESTFIIQFDLHAGWTIHEAHFYVGTTAPDGSNPGGFPYHLRSGTYNSSFTWIIDTSDFVAPACDSNLHIALHAVVADAGEYVETAWTNCSNPLNGGWGSSCDDYNFRCGCEDPEDPHPGDLECCDCPPGGGQGGGDCPPAQTHRFDLVWGGGNLGQNYEQNDFADVLITVDTESETVTLFLEEDAVVHQDRYELKEMHVATSTEHPDTWPNGFSPNNSPWAKIEFDPHLVIEKDDALITTFQHVFTFDEFCSANGDFCLNFTEAEPACNETFYVAVHVALCMWENCTAPPPPSPEPCIEVPEEETAYGLCPDTGTNTSNCLFIGNAWAQGAVLEFCCNDTQPPEPPGGPCTRTIGYWKTHNKYRTQQSQLIPWPIPDAEDNYFASCDELTWLEILWEPVRGNKWLVLAKQYIGATLNIAAGTDPTDIQAYLPCAEELLIDGSTDCRLDNKNAKACGKSVTKLASLLDGYNNGVTGPGHCDSDTIFCPDQCFCPVPHVGGDGKKRTTGTYVTPTVCVDDDEPKTMDLTGFNGDTTQFSLIDTAECDTKKVGLHRRVSDDGSTITLTVVGKGCCAAHVNVY
jgi:hypothetical protein